MASPLRHLLLLKIALAASLLLTLVASCNKGEKGAKEETPKTALAAPTAPAPIQVDPAREMAEKVVAALASNDYPALDAMLSDMARKELSELNKEMFHTLRASLEKAGIDLKKSKIERVESTGSDILAVDIFLSHEGRGFHFHFGVMTLGGGYDYTGHAQWFKWDDETDDGAD